MKPIVLLQYLLYFIAVFHIIFGTGFMFSVDFQKMAVAFYGGQLDWTARDIYFIRIIGSFAFILGFLAYMASRDPIRYRIVVIAFIEFFILRNICRHLFADELYISLGVSSTINLLTSVFFGFQALILAVLLWMTEKESLPQKKPSATHHHI